MSVFRYHLISLSRHHNEFFKLLTKLLNSIKNPKLLQETPFNPQKLFLMQQFIGFFEIGNAVAEDVIGGVGIVAASPDGIHHLMGGFLRR